MEAAKTAKQYKISKNTYITIIVQYLLKNCIVCYAWFILIPWIWREGKIYNAFRKRASDFPSLSNTT